LAATVEELAGTLDAFKSIKDMRDESPPPPEPNRIYVAVSGSGKTVWCKAHEQFVDMDELFVWPEKQRWWEDEDLAREVNDHNLQIARQFLKRKEGKIGLYADDFEGRLTVDGLVYTPKFVLEKHLKKRTDKSQPGLESLDRIIAGQEAVRARHPNVHVSFDGIPLRVQFADNRLEVDKVTQNKLMGEEDHEKGTHAKLTRERPECLRVKEWKLRDHQGDFPRCRFEFDVTLGRFNRVDLCDYCRVEVYRFLVKTAEIPCKEIDRMRFLNIIPIPWTRKVREYPRYALNVSSQVSVEAKFVEHEYSFWRRIRRRPAVDIFLTQHDVEDFPDLSGNPVMDRLRFFSWYARQVPRPHYSLTPREQGGFIKSTHRSLWETRVINDASLFGRPWTTDRTHVECKEFLATYLAHYRNDFMGEFNAGGEAAVMQEHHIDPATEYKLQMGLVTRDEQAGATGPTHLTKAMRYLGSLGRSSVAARDAALRSLGPSLGLNYDERAFLRSIFCPADPADERQGL
jgi:hypothetical protein